MAEFVSAPVCDTCWVEREGDRVPIRLNGVHKEMCHFCGQPTTSGIYQRAEVDVISDFKAVGWYGPDGPIHYFKDAMRWCTECGEQGVEPGQSVCTLCGQEQIEPFREGWDESD